VSKALQSLGLASGPVQTMYTMPGVIIALAQVLLPLMVLTLHGVFKSLDRDLEYAAMSLGARPSVALWLVTLRLARGGIVAGSLACVPLFFLLFLPADANGVRSMGNMASENFAFPAALQWKGVAEIIAKGLSGLPPSAIVSMIVATVAAVAIELARLLTRGRFALSAVSIGLGVVLPPESTFAMFVGALVFWLTGRRHRTPGTRGHDFLVEGLEPICAGLISGAALMGIGNAVLNVMFG
jgi:uncharacterized oligopeptide transporter (OPT) family protein